MTKMTKLAVAGVAAVLASLGGRGTAASEPQTVPHRIYVVDAPMTPAGDARVLAVDLDGTSRVDVLPLPPGARHPSIVLSPNGDSLYVSYSVLEEIDRPLKGVLEVFETATDSSVARVDNPSRWLSTGVTAQWLETAISVDGRWLFAMKRTSPIPGVTEYFVATFDTVAMEWLPDTAQVPMCVTGVMDPSRVRPLDIAVGCGHTRDVRFLSLNETGGLQGSSHAVDTRANAEHGHPAVVVRRSDNSLVAIEGGGEAVTVLPGRSEPQLLSRLRIDDVARRRAPRDWLRGRRVATQRASELDSELYLLLDGTDGMPGGTEIAVVSSSDLALRRTIQLSRNVVSLAMDTSRAELYAADMSAGVVVVVDGRTGRQLSELRGAAVSPAFVTIGSVPR